jgi:hypothetical protein
MRYQRTSERRAVILMVVLSLLTLFALVGVTFVLYADAEATAARVAREAQTMQAADVNPQEALAYFLGQLIYDVPDTVSGVGSGLRGHSLARTMYGYNYIPGPNFSPNIYPFNGVGRLHYPTASLVGYPTAPLTNVPNNYAGIMDDYALVNYTWFQSDNFVRDPERVGTRLSPSAVQINPYVGCNAPYTYPDLNNFFLAAMRADGTVLTPSYHRPWLFQVVNGKFYAFNDMTNPNWTNTVGKYLTLRPRPTEHPSFPLPGDATGDVKNLPWAPGGNDSIWIDLGAPVMTAPDGTPYKMMFAPLIIDLDNRINLNTAGNLLGYVANMAAPASWQQASNTHVSNQGWGPWEVNLSKVLWADQGLWTPSTPPTPPEWMRLLTGMSYVVPTPPNTSIVQPGVLPFPTPLPNAVLSAWLLPGVRGRYLEPTPGVWTPNAPPASAIPAYPFAMGLNATYQHSYAQSDENGLNEMNGAMASTRLALPGFPAGTTTSPFPNFFAGYYNGNAVEAGNHPLLYNALQSPVTSAIGTRAFNASDMEALLRPNASTSGPVSANASASTSDLQRLCPFNFASDAFLNAQNIPANIKSQVMSMALRFRNLVTTQSSDIGAPGVTPYWTSPMFETPNAARYYLYPPSGAAVPFPPPPTPGTPSLPLPSEFGNDWRALSANSSVYFPFSNPSIYPSPGARIRLNRPLPPYPHMGAGLTPPYTMLPPQPGQPATPTLSPYGMSYNLTSTAIANQYTAAQSARQALANDIYRRLLAITGLMPPANPANPTNTELAPFRYLAQLAVNIVDYIDEDDIMTPFNFYTVADGLPATSLGNTQGGDDPNATGANPIYWVFGTELPKVVINEVLAEASIPPDLNTTKAANPSTDQVKVWVELYNTMPAAGGTNTQPQDTYRVPLYITNPSGGGYSPYRISITQWTMDQSAAPLSAPGATLAELSDVSQNVLGKAYISGPFPQSTTDTDFSGIVPNSPGSTTANQTGFPVPGSSPLVTINAGVDPGNYFLVGPTPDATNFPNDPFVPDASTGKSLLPTGVPVLQTPHMAYTPTWAPNSTTDERSTGLTVMLRRLANPYLPPQPKPTLANYNPYVTVDYIPSVPLWPGNSGGSQIASFGKRQPYAGLFLLSSNTTYDKNGLPTIQFSPNSPVFTQSAAFNPFPKPPPGAFNTQNNVSNTFGKTNYPLPQSSHYDWLVHLDRAPISPMELLHVSAWPPYKLTQRFMLGDDTKATVTVPPPPSTYNWAQMYPIPPNGNMINTFAHYAPWFDLPPGLNAALPTMSCPWWFDDGTTGLAAGQSHRLYRLFEFLECGDRAFGVNGLGRIPGKVNINTIWDPEILQALIDANTSLGTNPLLPYAPVNPASGLPWNPAPADLVSQIFANMMNSRSPNYYGNGAYVASGTQVNAALRPPIGPVNMGTLAAGTGFDDRPFMPLSMGLYNQGLGTQFPNGMSILTDTILRTNNPPETAASTNTYPQLAAGAAAPNQYLLFQNYFDNGSTSMAVNPTTTPVTSVIHPYLQTQLLNKLYNNVTTRSNVFAVFLTVGYFQVIPGGAVGQPNVPQLGPEIGSSEGKQIRHRMFAIVDRTNLSTFTTASLTPVGGVTSVPLNLTGAATVHLPPLTVTVNPLNPAQLIVLNPTTGTSGFIQAGTQLVIDAGNVNEETVTVMAVNTPGFPLPNITANFTLPHALGFTITQRGNPGPWLTPYDPRLDPGVVLYFSIID